MLKTHLNVNKVELDEGEFIGTIPLYVSIPFSDITAKDAIRDALMEIGIFNHFQWLTSGIIWNGCYFTVTSCYGVHTHILFPTNNPFIG